MESVKTDFTHLDPPVDRKKDHILGNIDAKMTLVEFGSYACPSCQEAHKVITNLRDRFGEQLRYVYRHKPIKSNEIAEQAAILAEYASISHNNFWEVHVALMKRGLTLDKQDLDRIAEEFDFTKFDQINFSVLALSRQNVQEDIDSAQKSGVLITPTFFINNKRYEGPWDESSLSEALIGSLGHRFHSATVDFVRWGPSAGIMLLIMSILAICLVNSPIGPRFEAFWAIPFGFQINNIGLSLSLLDWINDGLLSLFFLVVGLEIKREFTVGRLASRQVASLSVAASFGGVVVPALIYLTIAPASLSIGWGTTISTDTAFAIALIVMLGNRVPVELRVFLTATAIVDDLISIIVVAIFYSDNIDSNYIIISFFITIVLMALNSLSFSNPLPYAILGVALWLSLHNAGIHSTLAGVIVALIIPTRPPANLRALNAQAQELFRTEALFGNDKLMRNSPSPNALRILDRIHDRIESPAERLLRSVEPWSSYFVLPLFALANAGVLLVFDFEERDLQLMLAIFLGLVIGKPVGIFSGAWLASKLKLAEKPASYSWRQLFGAGVIAGMGFTMSLFIAEYAFESPNNFSAAKIAIFIASITAGVLGSLFLKSDKKSQKPS